MNRRELIILFVIIVGIIGYIIYKLLFNDPPQLIDDGSDDNDIRLRVRGINADEIPNINFNIEDSKQAVRDSINNARALGVPEDKIIKDTSDLDQFML